MSGKAFTFLNPRLLVDFFFGKCIWCLHNEQKKLLVDMKFPFSCSTLTSECNKREKILSTRAHLLYFMIKHYHLEEDNG